MPSYDEFCSLQDRQEKCPLHGRRMRFKNYTLPDYCTCDANCERIYHELLLGYKCTVTQSELSAVRNEAADRFKKMIGLSIVNAFLTLGFGVDNRERGPTLVDDSAKRFQLMEL